MAGETDLHKTLKKEACRWLLRMGYRCIAAEVRLPPLGIVDAVGTGVFRAYQNYLAIPREIPQVCFIECKATRSDFLRDCSNDGQLEFSMFERHGKRKQKKRRAQAKMRGTGEIRFVSDAAHGEFALRAGAGGRGAEEGFAPRWGLLSYGETGVSVVVKPLWQESAQTLYVESAIARH